MTTVAPDDSAFGSPDAELPQRASAWSIGNRWFDFRAPMSTPLTVGAHVLITTPDTSYFGQLTDLAVESGPGGHHLLGGGSLLARLADGSQPVRTIDVFDSADIETAPPEMVAEWVAGELGSKGTLVLGSAIAADEAVRLRSTGFTRHTFLCGQSGSGKTYTLGVLLEQLLLETELRIIVLDPNSDYVGLGDMRVGADTADAERIADISRRTCVFRNRPDGYRLRIMFGRLPLPMQAQMLGLEPIRDGELYDALRTATGAMPSTEYSLVDLRNALGAHDADKTGEALARRVDNLGLLDWSIWADSDERPFLDQLPDDWRAAIIDLGEIETASERSAIAGALLSGMWVRRSQREPMLIVIDEAHNICPAEPADFRQAAAAEHTINIAAEGRKYGLYLLLSTQRPQKLHVNVLTQCENLLLMHVNSAADLDHLATAFAQVPRALIDQAGGFGLGEGLVAGRIAACPTLFRGGTRRSPEGGADVPTTWASRAAP